MPDGDLRLRNLRGLELVLLSGSEHSWTITGDALAEILTVKDIEELRDDADRDAFNVLHSLGQVMVEAANNGHTTMRLTQLVRELAEKMEGESVFLDPIRALLPNEMYPESEEEDR